jgi:hypothetical protein
MQPSVVTTDTHARTNPRHDTLGGRLMCGSRRTARRSRSLAASRGGGGRKGHRRATQSSLALTASWHAGREPVSRNTPQGGRKHQEAGGRQAGRLCSALWCGECERVFTTPCTAPVYIPALEKYCFTHKPPLALARHVFIKRQMPKPSDTTYRKSCSLVRPVRPVPVRSCGRPARVLPRCGNTMAWRLARTAITTHAEYFNTRRVFIKRQIPNPLDMRSHTVQVNLSPLDETCIPCGKPSPLSRTDPNQDNQHRHCTCAGATTMLI